MPTSSGQSKGPSGVVMSSFYRDTTSSPRYPGSREIMIRSNPHVYMRGRVLEFSPQTTPTMELNGNVNASNGPLGSSFEGFRDIQNRLENRAYSRFTAKTRKGAAAMGMTVATWRQSRDMFSTRLGRVSSALQTRIRSLERNPRKLALLRKEIEYQRKRRREPVANLILEGEFGWAPLVQDLNAAASLATSPFPPDFTRSRAREVFRRSKAEGTDPRILNSEDGLMSVTYAALVKVQNPNSYLAQKSGLINAPAVAWDLVPWSFVVNMFVNTNQMIGSLTNEIGLDITSRSVTVTRAMTRERYVVYKSLPKNGVYRTFGKEKRRTTVSSFPLHWETKLPNFDWNLALIASSLVVQRFRKLNQLIRF